MSDTVISPNPPTTISPAPGDQQPAFTPSPFQEVSQFSNPWDSDQAFKDLVQTRGYSCPGSNVGDYAFTAWLYDFFLGATGATRAPAAAPTITSLNPSSTPANADVTLGVSGTGFDSGALVMVGPTELSPTGTPTPSTLSVPVPAATISIAGAVDITVKNGDGALSNVMSLTLS